MVRVLTRQERRALERLERKAKKPCVSETQLCYLYWLIPCLAAFLIYAHSLSFGFVHDDWGQIVYNKQIQSWSYFPRLLSTHVWSQFSNAYNGPEYYRPVFSLWMLAVHTITGLSPFGWHLSNVLLHVIATFAVYLFASELLNSQIAASAVALFFAVHPAHIEDVCWVAASNEMIYTVFLLCSFVCLLRWLERSQPVWIWLSLGAWCAALFAKETAIAVLPIFVLLALRGWSKQGFRNCLKIVAAYAAVAAVYLAVRLALLHTILSQHNGGVSWKEVVLTGPFATMFYLKKLIIPTELFPEYRIVIQREATLEVWLAAGLILLVIALLVYLGRESRVWLVGLAFVCLPLLPVLAGIHFYSGIIEIEAVHDRYLYLPSVGLTLMLGLLVKYLWKQSRFVELTLAGLSIAALVCLNVTQQNYYKNEASLILTTSRVYDYKVDWLTEIGLLLSEDAVGLCREGDQQGAREALDLTEFPRPISELNFHERDGLWRIYHGHIQLATTQLEPNVVECLQTLAAK